MKYKRLENCSELAEEFGLLKRHGFEFSFPYPAGPLPEVISMPEQGLTVRFGGVTLTDEDAEELAPLLWWVIKAGKYIEHLEVKKRTYNDLFGWEDA